MKPEGLYSSKCLILNNQGEMEGLEKIEKNLKKDPQTERKERLYTEEVEKLRSIQTGREDYRNHTQREVFEYLEE